MIFEIITEDGSIMIDDHGKAKKAIALMRKRGVLKGAKFHRKVA